VYALGVAFYQADKAAGKEVFFVRPFAALPDYGTAVLRMGAALLKDGINQLRAAD
jgi:hypothetical protein